MTSFITIKNRFTIISVCLFLYLQCANSKAISTKDLNIEEQFTLAESVRSSDPKKLQEILSLLKSNENLLSSDQKYHLSYLVAYKQSMSGQLEESIINYKSILNSNANTELKFRANLSIINTFGITQNWADGLLHLSILLEQLPEIKTKKVKMDGIALTAMFYNQVHQYSLGLKYAELLAKSISSERHNCMAAMVTIESKLHLKQLQNNNNEIQEAIALCKNETIAANFIRSYHAKYNIENNSPVKVIENLTSQLTEINSTKYPRLIVEIYTLLAEAYWLQGNLNKTEELALESIEIGKNIQTTQAVISAYKLLYKISKKRSKHQESALKYYEIYTELDKTYINETQAKHLAFQLAQHKAIEQKNQIDLLNKKNSLLTAEQALASANAANNRLIILVLALTLSVLTFWGLRLLKAHKRIKELAEYDSLTGIFNRGHFVQVANNALKYCQSAEQDLSLIMFDLDHFKKINDTFGHACGDWALQKAVEVCKDIGRQNDIFARLGGEEFCILLNSCDSKVAFERAEACRKAIAAINTADSGFDFTITASFGVTDANTSGYDLEKLLADADSAAYSSKHAGRDRTTIFEIKPVQQTMQLDDSRNIF